MEMQRNVAIKKHNIVEISIYKAIINNIIVIWGLPFYRASCRSWNEACWRIPLPPFKFVSFTAPGAPSNATTSGQNFQNTLSPEIMSKKTCLVGVHMVVYPKCFFCNTYWGTGQEEISEPFLLVCTLELLRSTGIDSPPTPHRMLRFKKKNRNLPLFPTASLMLGFSFRSLLRGARPEAYIKYRAACVRFVFWASMSSKMANNEGAM